MTDAWIAAGYHDLQGIWHPTPPDTGELLRAMFASVPEPAPSWFVPQGEPSALLGPAHLVLEDGTEVAATDALPDDLPIGYHELHPDDGGPVTFLVVHPARAPDAPNAWGVAAQLHSLRSEGSQGIGDLADLGALLRWCDRNGARAVLISPLHAPAPTLPQQDSPYSPSSRLWWNPSLLRVPGLPADDGTALVDRDRVWEAKRSALWSWFVTAGVGTGWQRWAAEQGETLQHFAVWCELAVRHGSDWRRWPTEMRHPANARLAPEDLEFHMWCQWLVSRQLEEARRGAPDIALIGDLALGFAPEGADAWAFQDQLALDWSIGAPPDAFATDGQAWGLPPFVPSALRAARYAPFIATLRAAMRGLSGLRIDHVMGMFRQWWIPPSGSPHDGCYVHFPAEELMAIVRIEAARAGTFVVGEDLGIVEPDVRRVMTDSGLLGTKVGWFEEEPPSRWPAESLATITTHDLPTLAGVWLGDDGDAAMRQRLMELSGLGRGAPVESVIAATHRSLAASPSRIRLVTMEDLCAVTARPNVPGTVHEHPNWRRRLPLSIEDLDRTAIVRSTLSSFSAVSSG